MYKEISHLATIVTCTTVCFMLTATSVCSSGGAGKWEEEVGEGSKGINGDVRSPFAGADINFNLGDHYIYGRNKTAICTQLD